jgi:predicted amidohydrolase
MPLNGRNYLVFTELAANAHTLSPREGQASVWLGGSRSQESVSVGGQRIMFDRYTLDGIVNTDVDYNSFVVEPTVDAIQEMKVQTGVYLAEFDYNATQGQRSDQEWHRSISRGWVRVPSQ